MAKKSTVRRHFWSDMDNDTIFVGSRVELHPAMDLWMRGAKYGTIVRVRAGKPCVRMDHKGVRKLVCTIPANLKRRT